jgi:mannitol/fructose-specific phosphotransferase system IIA component (Ntr-type)
MIYLQRKESYNGNTTAAVSWLVKTTDTKALYKIIKECKTKKEAIELIKLYNTIEGNN